jgi:hypothetical protein
MVKSTDIIPAGTSPEEEIARLAGKILKVYGKVEAPTLTREIIRMAEILGIPTEEIFKHD